MFAIVFRTGYESHDVYTYGSWMTLTTEDEEIWNFQLAEDAVNELCHLLVEDEWSGTWQIASIERVMDMEVRVYEN